MSGSLLKIMLGYWVAIHLPKAQLKLDVATITTTGGYCLRGGGNTPPQLMMQFNGHLRYRWLFKAITEIQSDKQST